MLFDIGGLVNVNPWEVLGSVRHWLSSLTKLTSDFLAKFTVVLPDLRIAALNAASTRSRILSCCLI